MLALLLQTHICLKLGFQYRRLRVGVAKDKVSSEWLNDTDKSLLM